MLCAPNKKFQGCELLFNDTVFFDSNTGKASEIIQTNKEGYLVSINRGKRLSFLEIKESFKKIIKKRRHQNKQNVKTTASNHLKQQDLIDLNEKHQDFAIFRYKKNLLATTIP